MNATVKGVEKRMDIIQKRQLISAVLAEYFNPDQLERIMRLWDSHYSREPIFVLQRFIKYSCQSEGVDVQPSVILKALVAHINREQTQSMVNEPAQELDNTQLAFYQLLKLMLLDTPEAKRPQIITAFADDISALDTPKLDEFALWLVKKQPLKPSLSQSEMKQSIMQLYRNLCDWLGAPEADNILGQAIRSCRKQGLDNEISVLI